MDALYEVLQLCPIPIKHVEWSITPDGHGTFSCELADLTNGPLNVEQSTQIEHMFNELINMGCTVLSTTPVLYKLSIEVAYSSFDDWLDAVGTIISIERTTDRQLCIERYDPTIMDTVITYRTLYEPDLMQQLAAFKL